MRDTSGPYVEGDVRVPLAISWSQMVQNRHLVDESLGEDRELIRTILRGRHNEEVEVRVDE